MAGLARTRFDTVIGRCGIGWTDAGVARFALPGGPATPVTEPVPDRVRAVIDAVRRHLAGDLDDLRWIVLDTAGIPEFDLAVYRLTRAIDPGDTRSYGDIAHALGRPGAAQAVGRALGRNPIPLIVPCHRVLAAGGELHGFSAPGGIAAKRDLLALERTPGFDDPVLF